METAELPALPPTEPLLAGRYALGDAVGVGGPALVYRAVDRRTGRDVAVKLYPPGLIDPDRTRRQTEFDLLVRLRHPHLVELLDVGEDDGRLYLVMPLVDGPTLEQRMAVGPLPPAEVARLGAALADALAHVHRSGVAHRDVKPANVLLGQRPLLTEFGIARLLGGSGTTAPGWVVGSPAYLAPEQVGGDEVGPPADVYALGAVLVDALTGGSAEPHGFDRAGRPPAVPPGLPGLTETLRAMTAPGPGRRPTAARVAEDLNRAAPGLEGLPALPPSGPAGPSPRGPLAVMSRAPAAGRPGDRRRPVLAAALVVLALCGAAVGMRSAAAVEDGPAPTPAVSAPDVAPQPARPLPAPVPAWDADSGIGARGGAEDGDRAGRGDEARDEESGRSGGSGSGSGGEGSGGEGSGGEGSGGEGSDGEGSGDGGSDGEGSGGGGSGDDGGSSDEG